MEWNSHKHSYTYIHSHSLTHTYIHTHYNILIPLPLTSLWSPVGSLLRRFWLIPLSIISNSYRIRDPWLTHERSRTEETRVPSVYFTPYLITTINKVCCHDDESFPLVSPVVTLDLDPEFGFRQTKDLTLEGWSKTPEGDGLFTKKRQRSGSLPL